MINAQNVISKVSRYCTGSKGPRYCTDWASVLVVPCRSSYCCWGAAKTRTSDVPVATSIHARAQLKKYMS